MPETTPELISPVLVRRLARLVTVLTLVMIVGLIAVVGMLAVKLTETPELVLPETVTLPDGATAQAVTVTASELLVLTDSTLLVYDRSSGALLKSITLGD